MTEPEGLSRQQKAEAGTFLRKGAQGGRGGVHPLRRGLRRARGVSHENPLPELGLHLDIGHCHLEGGESSIDPILAVWGKRLRHVHIHDNFGGEDDLHLPLGAGTLDLSASVWALKSIGYDGTVSLEVYAPDRSLLMHSVETFRRAWSEAR